jgi:protein transport protein SEC24
LNYATPAGTKHTLDFRLPNLRHDDTIVANLKVQENLSEPFVFFQFVCLHTTPQNQRIIRLINLRLAVANDINSFIKSIDNDSYVFSRLQAQLQILMQNGKRDACEKIMKKAISMFAFYRYDAGGTYDTREFALPERLRNFPLFFSSMLKEPCFNPKLKITSSESFANLTTLRALPFASLLYRLYPKILDLNDIHDQLEKDENAEFGYQVEGKTVLANSIPANVKMVKPNGIYLIDNGEYIFLYIKKEASMEVLMDLLGVPDFISAQTIKNLPYLEESDFNIRINAMIDRLRQIKTGEFLTTLVICEGDRNVSKLKYVFMEDLGTLWSNNYWEFLSHLHEKVKDSE